MITRPKFMVLLLLLLAAFTACLTLLKLLYEEGLPSGRQPVSASDADVSSKNMIVVYNRIPKTGSTSLMHLPYELFAQNDYSVLLLNVTGSSSHLMSLPDQLYFANNITAWKERIPAIYHGHFAFFDIQNRAPDKSVNIQYINVIRKPLDRLVSYYYFLRYGDDYLVNKVRRRMGDKTTFDECVAKQQRDCDHKMLWLQVPWFCGHQKACWDPPGNTWALQQAKLNLAKHYLAVGITEQLEDFVDILEVLLPRFFRGAGSMFRSSGKWSHIRNTRHKVAPSQETMAKMKSSVIWQMEHEFYSFAKAQFNALKSDISDTESGKEHKFVYGKVRSKT